MGDINRHTSPHEIAVRVSQALENAGITAILSGGGAVSIYSENDYQSRDLDFVTNARNEAIDEAIRGLGFLHIVGARQFEHPESEYYVEFPPGPLAFGETIVHGDPTPTLQTEYGPLRIVTPTQSVMDRLAAYIHWRDRQALDQAIMVARRQAIDWKALEEWVVQEGAQVKLVDKLRTAAGVVKRS